MPLCMATVGEVNIIKKITGKDEVRGRLAELGFVVGTEVKIISKMGDNMILSVLDSRVALDVSMTARMIV